MQNNLRKLSVYMESLKNEKGFTLISVLTMFSMILFTLPFLGAALQSVQRIDNYEALAVEEFFRFIRDDIIQSTEASESESSLLLYQKDDNMATISQYQNLIRRQVDNQGHEIYLRNVDTIQFFHQADGIRIILKMESGATYERLFRTYQTS